MCIDDVLMALCIDRAWQYQSLSLPNPAVGAMVYEEGGRILSLEAHKKAGLPHAEILAVFWAFALLYTQRDEKKWENLPPSSLTPPLESSLASHLDSQKPVLLRALAPLWQSFQARHTEFATLPLDELPNNAHALHSFLLAYHQGVFRDTNIVLTLEPCNHTGRTPPCAKLLAELQPRRVHIAARDEWGESAYGAERLRSAGVTVRFTASATLKQRAQDLLYPFLCLRDSGRFVLFKLASRLDGSYKGGQISGALSRRFTHNQRSIAQSIIISGATARNDKPRLNSRYATAPYDAKREPDIGIFTRSKSLAHCYAKDPCAKEQDPQESTETAPTQTNTTKQEKATTKAQGTQEARPLLAPNSQTTNSHTKKARKDPPFSLDSPHKPRKITLYNEQNLHTLPRGFHIIEGSLQLYATISSLLDPPPLLLLHLSTSLPALRESRCNVQDARQDFRQTSSLTTGTASALSPTAMSAPISIPASILDSALRALGNLPLRLLHSEQLEGDLLLWLRP